MPGVIVFGGAGFIGSNLTDELMVQGHEVTVFDDLSEGTLDNIERWRGHKNFSFVKGDIRDFNLVSRAVANKEWVFHLAAMSRVQPSITDPLLAFSQNIMGTANVLEAARKHGIKRVVYSASSSAYGLKNEIPNHEEQPSDCLNAYSLSKKCGEELCKLYSDLYGVSTVSLRYFNVYGPRHQEEGSYATVIAIFRKQKRLGQKLTIVGDGEQRRDFTFVSDVVRANILAAMNRDAKGIYNIGTGENYSINEVADLVGGEKTYIEQRLGEARVTLANSSLARNTLGWKPLVNLKQGLEIIDLYEKRFPKKGSIIL